MKKTKKMMMKAMKNYRCYMTYSIVTTAGGMVSKMSVIKNGGYIIAIAIRS